ncbi:MAG: hypothetical protein HLUCCA12_09800 [Rhodobacteraceae bacterium HLUCCA12]|nr:MAG: hypothetical protein HLUCCA12_09800 [Rhodobacteraceae bacterium HLUCCA12]
MWKAIVLPLAAVSALAACGNNPGEQALFGGGAGAVGAAALGGDPVAGAAVGAGGNVLYCQANPGRCRR